jgi:hypothetical protein
VRAADRRARRPVVGRDGAAPGRRRLPEPAEQRRGDRALRGDDDVGRAEPLAAGDVHLGRPRRTSLARPPRPPPGPHGPRRQPCRELRRQLLHAERRHGDLAAEEGPEHQLGHAARGRHPGVEERAGEERAEEAGGDRRREPAVVSSCRVGRCGPVARSGRAGRAPAAARRAAAPRRRPSRPRGGDRSPPTGSCSGSASRRNRPDGGRDPGEKGRRSSASRSNRARRRVAGEQHLEAAVEPEPVDDVGADPAADPSSGLQHRHLTARPRAAATGAGQAGQPGTDDHHVGIHAASPLPSATRSARRGEGWTNSKPASEQARRDTPAGSPSPASRPSRRTGGLSANGGIGSTVGRFSTSRWTWSARRSSPGRAR